VLVGSVGVLAGALLSLSVATKLQAVSTALASVATAAYTAVQWLFNAALMANPIGIVIVALAALGAGLVIAYQKSATFREIVGGAFQAVKNIVADVVGGILGNIDFFLAGLQKMFSAASHIPFVGDKFRGIADAIGTARAAVQGLQADIDGLHSKTIQVITEIQTVALTGDAKHHATGGLAKAGELAWVGERGPELVAFGSAARVFSNADSFSMAGASSSVVGASPGRGFGGGDVIVHVYSDVTGRELVEKVRNEFQKIVKANGSLGFAT
jgi:hypothetical protein